MDRNRSATRTMICAEKGSTLTDLFKDLGLGGVLMKMAEGGQILDLRCEMPTCLCPNGRGCFEPCARPMPDWAPNVDHYPNLKHKEGKRTPDNVRLAHVACNNFDYGFRRKVGVMLVAGKTLKEIADHLNAHGQWAAWGKKEWTARSVRKAYVS